MAARRQYVSGCRSLFPTYVAAFGGEVYKDSLAFPAAIISSPAGKRQRHMGNYMMSVRHMKADICEQKARFPIFHGSVAEAHI